MMLEYLREHDATVLAQSTTAALATDGPAGLLVDVVPCATAGLRLYMLVPRTSDHLVNLEATPEAAIATCRWQARGNAHVVPKPEWPANLAHAHNAGHALV